MQKQYLHNIFVDGEYRGGCWDKEDALRIASNQAKNMNSKVVIEKTNVERE